MLPQKVNGEKWRLLYYGDLGAATGFNTVSANILDNLYKTGMFDISVLAINNWGDYHPDQARYKIYPASNNRIRDPYGSARFQKFLLDENEDFDIVFVLQDTFILRPYIEELFLKSRKILGKKYASIFYFPIDGVPRPDWIKAAYSFDCPVTYTNYAYGECLKVFPHIKNKLSIIPHGVNTNEFFPLPPDYSAELKKEYFYTVPDVEKKFMFFRIDRNQPRKDYPRSLLAFREFLKRNPDSAFMYCHCEENDEMGYNLGQAARSMGLVVGKDIVFPDKFNVKRGYPVQAINKIYNMADCALSTALGGGWELINTESMATKTPIIAPNNTAFRELIGPKQQRGYLVDSGKDINDYIMMPKDSESLRPLTNLHSLVDTMEHVYNNYDEALEKAQVAYDYVTSRLVWEKNVMPKWFEIFGQLMSLLNQKKYSVTEESYDVKTYMV